MKAEKKHHGDLTGVRIGRLVVIEKSHKDKWDQWHWKCRCDCGEICTKESYNLRYEKTSSCGCYHKEVAAKAQTKHGLSRHPLYHIRSEMIARTTNPNNSHYYTYGGRGIKVCDEWSCKENGVVNFYNWAMENGYKKGLSIDRIDNDGDYEPSNCRWTDDYTQSRNTTKNKFITFNGRTMTVTDWGLELGGSEGLVKDRLKWGWSIEKALTTPPRRITKGKNKNI